MSRILIACEESQATTKAFRELGHEAYSCDLLPCNGDQYSNHMKNILYARVSTKGQGDSGLGLEAQRAIAYTFFPDISKEFIEVGSGKDTVNRPVLQQAIQYCLDNGAYLVVAKVDRLSRDVVDGLTILEKLGGRIRFCDMPGDVDKFMLTLFFAFAERERMLISIRTKAALQECRKAGKKLGGTRTFSAEDSAKGAMAMAQKARSNRQNVRAKSMAVILREKGLTLQAIADQLNGSEFKSPRKGSWSPVTVSRLLK